MMIFDELGFKGSRGPLFRAQNFALEHLISLHCVSGDFRWALVALALRWFAALEAFARKQLVCLARSVMGRAWQGARFAGAMTAADTMVAAGGG